MHPSLATTVDPLCTLFHSPSSPDVPGHEVVWLDISMDDPTLMQGSYHGQQFSRVVEHQGLGYRTPGHTVSIGNVLGREVSR